MDQVFDRVPVKISGLCQSMVASTYRAPRWLPGGHLQTIYPAKFIPKPRVNFRRERWATPDGDFIDLDFTEGQHGKPFLVLFHGLEGNSDSHYARALMAHISSLGWSGAVSHFRSCSGELNTAPRFYHSGDAEEADWILRRLHTHSQSIGAGLLYAVGASLGGNVLLRWLGEYQNEASFVHAACAVSTPLCLAGGARAISSGFNRLYTRIFLDSLKPKCLLKLEQHPGLFDADALRQVRTIYDFDNIVTAPLHGFRNTDDYYHRASSKHVLNDITVPTLILNAQNDPFLPAQHLPETASPAVTLEFPAEGGHIGFTANPFPGKLTWLPNRITQFLQTAS